MPAVLDTADTNAGRSIIGVNPIAPFGAMLTMFEAPLVAGTNRRKIKAGLPP